MGQPSRSSPPTWAGLPSAEAVRAATALLVVALLSVLAAFVLGEYEFEGWLPAVAGLLFGEIVAEVVIGIARRRSLALALAAGAFAAGGLVWAGWIAAGEGLAPIPGLAWLAAVVAAATVVLRVVGLRRRRGEPGA